MYNSSFLNNNDENSGQNVSQEYSAPTYHEMQPASFAPTPQPPSFAPIPQPPSFDGNRCKLVFKLYHP